MANETETKITEYGELANIFGRRQVQTSFFLFQL
jgi:hypothetical protein